MINIRKFSRAMIGPGVRGGNCESNFFKICLSDPKSEIPFFLQGLAYNVKDSQNFSAV